MSLAKLPETFSIEELTKGYLPHLSNRLENQAYCGDVPKQDEYCTEFICASIIDILGLCCIIFREEFLKITDVDPF